MTVNLLQVILNQQWNTQRCLNLKVIGPWGHIRGMVRGCLCDFKRSQWLFWGEILLQINYTCWLRPRRNSTQICSRPFAKPNTGEIEPRPRQDPQKEDACMIYLPYIFIPCREAECEISELVFLWSQRVCVCSWLCGGGLSESCSSPFVLARSPSKKKKKKIMVSAQTRKKLSGAWAEAPLN